MYSLVNDDLCNLPMIQTALFADALAKYLYTLFTTKITGWGDGAYLNKKKKIKQQNANNAHECWNILYIVGHGLFFNEFKRRISQRAIFMGLFIADDV